MSYLTCFNTMFDDGNVFDAIYFSSYHLNVAST